MTRAQKVNAARLALALGFCATVVFTINEFDHSSPVAKFAEVSIAITLFVGALALQRRYPEARDPSKARAPGTAAGDEVQIAGRRCAACEKRIVVRADGEACDVCSAPVHRGACRARHGALSHPVVADVPYR